MSAAFGAGYAMRASDAVANAQAARMQQELAAQRAELQAAREEAQREINAVAAASASCRPRPTASTPSASA